MPLSVPASLFELVARFMHHETPAQILGADVAGGLGNLVHGRKSPPAQPITAESGNYQERRHRTKKHELESIESLSKFVHCRRDRHIIGHSRDVNRVVQHAKLLARDLLGECAPRRRWAFSPA